MNAESNGGGDNSSSSFSGSSSKNHAKEKMFETMTVRQRFPKRRFGHIAHKVGEELIISHGNNDGRLLSDCWALDLMELRWKRKELKWPGHRARIGRRRRDGGWRDLLVSRRWHEERRRRVVSYQGNDQ